MTEIILRPKQTNNKSTINNYKSKNPQCTFVYSYSIIWIITITILGFLFLHVCVIIFRCTQQSEGDITLPCQSHKHYVTLMDGCDFHP